MPSAFTRALGKGISNFFLPTAGSGHSAKLPPLPSASLIRRSTKGRVGDLTEFSRAVKPQIDSPRAAAPGRPRAAARQRRPVPAPRAALPSPCAAPASHRAAADAARRRPSPRRARAGRREQTRCPAALPGHLTSARARGCTRRWEAVLLPRSRAYRGQAATLVLRPLGSSAPLPQAAGAPFCSSLETACSCWC